MNQICLDSWWFPLWDQAWQAYPLLSSSPLSFHQALCMLQAMRVVQAPPQDINCLYLICSLYSTVLLGSPHYLVVLPSSLHYFAFFEFTTLIGYLVEFFVCSTSLFRLSAYLSSISNLHDCLAKFFLLLNKFVKFFLLLNNLTQFFTQLSFN